METIKIISVELEKTKAGVPFAKVDTDKGKMSAWDTVICDTLKANIGNSVTVEIKESPDGKFKNIRGIAFKGEEVKDTPVSHGASKDLKITALALTKCMFYGRTDANADEVIEAYEFILSKLK